MSYGNTCVHSQAQPANWHSRLHILTLSDECTAMKTNRNFQQTPWFSKCHNRCLQSFDLKLPRPRPPETRQHNKYIVSHTVMWSTNPVHRRQFYISKTKVNVKCNHTTHPDEQFSVRPHTHTHTCRDAGKTIPASPARLARCNYATKLEH